MKRIAVAVGVLVLLARPTFASPIVDQSFVPDPTSFITTTNNLGWVAQSFTVGVDGQLTGIDLVISRIVGITTDDGTLGIYDLVNGLPGTALQTIQVSASAVPFRPNSPPTPLTHFDGFSIPVLAGQHYAIVVGSLGIQGFSLEGSASASGLRPTYAGGEFLTSGDGGATWAPFTALASLAPFDLAFQTHVDTTSVPEPASLLLLSTGLLGLMTCGRRRPRGRGGELDV